jgi:hypothetical protein
MIAFYVLNGLGVIFMLYVLIQFWKEGHRSVNRTARKYKIDASEMGTCEAVAVARPIRTRAQGKYSVIPIRPSEGEQRRNQGHEDMAMGTTGIPRTKPAGYTGGKRLGQ